MFFLRWVYRISYISWVYLGVYVIYMGLDGLNGEFVGISIGFKHDKWRYNRIWNILVDGFLYRWNL